MFFIYRGFIMMSSLRDQESEHHFFAVLEFFLVDDTAVAVHGRATNS